MVCMALGCLRGETDINVLVIVPICGVPLGDTEVDLRPGEGQTFDGFAVLCSRKAASVGFFFRLVQQQASVNWTELEVMLFRHQAKQV